MINKYFSIALLTSLAAPLYSMKVAPQLLVVNEMDDKIEFIYSLKRQEEKEKPKERYHGTLGRDQPFSHPIEEIDELYVFSYGKLMGKLRTAYLSGGLIPEENIAQRKPFIDAQDLHKPYQLRIKKGGSWITSWLGNNRATRVAREFCPYSVEEDHFKLEESRDRLKGLYLDFFPQVRDADQKDAPIFPRYVLSVPEGASVDSINMAYDRQAARCQPFVESSKKWEREHGKRLLYIVEQAYKKMIGDKSERFCLVITEHFHHHLTEFPKQEEAPDEELEDYDAHYNTPVVASTAFEGPVSDENDPYL